MGIEKNRLEAAAGQSITREAVAQILYNALEKAGLTGKLGG